MSVSDPAPPAPDDPPRRRRDRSGGESGAHGDDSSWADLVGLGRGAADPEDGSAPPPSGPAPTTSAAPGLPPAPAPIAQAYPGQAAAQTTGGGGRRRRAGQADVVTTGSIPPVPAVPPVSADPSASPVPGRTADVPRRLRRRAEPAGPVDARLPAEPAAPPPPAAPAAHGTPGGPAEPQGTPGAGRSSHGPASGPPRPWWSGAGPAAPEESGPGGAGGGWHQEARPAPAWPGAGVRSPAGDNAGGHPAPPPLWQQDRSSSGPPPSAPPATAPPAPPGPPAPGSSTSPARPGSDGPPDAGWAASTAVWAAGAAPAAPAPAAAPAAPAGRPPTSLAPAGPAPVTGPAPPGTPGQPPGAAVGTPAGPVAAPEPGRGLLLPSAGSVADATAALPMIPSTTSPPVPPPVPSVASSAVSSAAARTSRGRSRRRLAVAPERFPALSPEGEIVEPPAGPPDGGAARSGASRIGPAPSRPGGTGVLGAAGTIGAAGVLGTAGAAARAATAGPGATGPGRAATGAMIGRTTGIPAADPAPGRGDPAGDDPARTGPGGAQADPPWPVPGVPGRARARRSTPPRGVVPPDAPTAPIVTSPPSAGIGGLGRALGAVTTSAQAGGSAAARSAPGGPPSGLPGAPAGGIVPAAVAGGALAAGVAAGAAVVGRRSRRTSRGRTGVDGEPRDAPGIGDQDDPPVVGARVGSPGQAPALDETVGLDAVAGLDAQAGVQTSGRRSRRSGEVRRTADTHRPGETQDAAVEPAATGPAPPVGRAGRNLPAAIGVGLLLVAAILGSLFVRKEAFVVLVGAAVVLGVRELAGALAAKDISIPVIPLAVGSLGMLVSAFVAGEEGLLVSFTLTAFGVLLWRIVDGMDGAARDVAASVFVAAYVPFLAGFAILLLAQDDGPLRIVVFIAVTVANDVGGYVAGVLFGRHPMAPTVSPKKSWEGFAGSAVLCVVVGVALVTVLLDGAWYAGAAVGAAAVVTATVGDLSESLLKRDLGVKDMGDLLPGHGGIMDRLDSLLPTAPAVYFLLALLVA